MDFVQQLEALALENEFGVDLDGDNALRLSKAIGDQVFAIEVVWEFHVTLTLRVEELPNWRAFVYDLALSIAEYRERIEGQTKTRSILFSQQSLVFAIDQFVRGHQVMLPPSKSRLR